MPNQKGYLYRFMEISYAPPLDEWDQPAGLGKIELHLEMYPVLKWTRCGAWINLHGTRRFVNLQARKKFACASQSAAHESYVARKRRQIRILQAQIRKAETGLKLLMARRYEHMTYDMYTVVGEGADDRAAG